MRPDDILAYVRREPFQPFRLTLTDGRTYDVRHPELVMVGRSSLTIGLARRERAEPVYDRIVNVSLLHIMQIELMEAAAPPQTC